MLNPLTRVNQAATKLTEKAPEILGRVAQERNNALRRQVHDSRTAAILGICLGITFLACFLTGLYSHYQQHPPSWLAIPPQPFWLYQVTQGIHVASGLASVPLLMAKLWTAYPRLFKWPPVDSVAHAVERLMLVPLVFGSLFMLFSGVANVARWYPWEFFFPAAHFHAAWITIGALVIHLGAKAGITRRALWRQPVTPALVVSERPEVGLGRRGFLAAVAASVGLVTVTTAGQTFPPLRRFVLFAQRRPDIGSQGVPVNKSAASAGVTQTAVQPTYRLRVTGTVSQDLELTLNDLRRRINHEAVLPIACVEGWSASARWRGVPLRDLLDEAGASEDASVEVRSLQERGGYKTSTVNHVQARHPDTILALELNGEPLNLDHGFPCRLIGPNRPGVMQTKWVTELVVS